MVGCRKYSPFLGALNTRACILMSPENETMILTTPHGFHSRGAEMVKVSGAKVIAVDPTGSERMALKLYFVQGPVSQKGGTSGDKPMNYE